MAGQGNGQGNGRVSTASSPASGRWFLDRSPILAPAGHRSSSGTAPAGAGSVRAAATPGRRGLLPRRRRSPDARPGSAGDASSDEDDAMTAAGLDAGAGVRPTTAPAARITSAAWQGGGEGRPSVAASEATNPANDRNGASDGDGGDDGDAAASVRPDEAFALKLALTTMRSVHEEEMQRIQRELAGLRMRLHDVRSAAEAQQLRAILGTPSGSIGRDRDDDALLGLDERAPLITLAEGRIVDCVAASRVEERPLPLAALLRVPHLRRQLHPDGRVIDAMPDTPLQWWEPVHDVVFASVLVMHAAMYAIAPTAPAPTSSSAVTWLYHLLVYAALSTLWRDAVFYANRFVCSDLVHAVLVQLAIPAAVLASAVTAGTLFTSSIWHFAAAFAAARVALALASAWSLWTLRDHATHNSLPVLIMMLASPCAWLAAALLHHAFVSPYTLAGSRFPFHQVTLPVLGAVSLLDIVAPLYWTRLSRMPVSLDHIRARISSATLLLAGFVPLAALIPWLTRTLESSSAVTSADDTNDVIVIVVSALVLVISLTSMYGPATDGATKLSAVAQGASRPRTWILLHQLLHLGLLGLAAGLVFAVDAVVAVDSPAANLFAAPPHAMHARVVLCAGTALALLSVTLLRALDEENPFSYAQPRGYAVLGLRSLSIAAVAVMMQLARHSVSPVALVILLTLLVAINALVETVINAQLRRGDDARFPPSTHGDDASSSLANS